MVRDDRIIFLPDRLTSKRLITLAQLLKTAGELSHGPDGARRVRLFDDLKSRALPLYTPERFSGRFGEGPSVFQFSEDFQVSRPDPCPPVDVACDGGASDRRVRLEAFEQGTRLLEEIRSVLVAHALVDKHSSPSQPSPPESLVGLVLSCVLYSLRQGKPVESHPLLNDLIVPQLSQPEPWDVRLPGWGRAETKRDYEKRARAAFRLKLAEHLKAELRRRERLLALGRNPGNRRYSAKRYVPLDNFQYFVKFQLVGRTAKQIAEEAGSTKDRLSLDPNDAVLVKQGCKRISGLAGIRLRSAKKRV